MAAAYSARMRTIFLSLLALSLSSITIQVNGMEVDGQRVSIMECELDSGGLFASAIVVSSLSKEKAALDACAPDGGAYDAVWTWGSGAKVEVIRGEPAAGIPCIQKALETVESDLNGSCNATLLVGDAAGADTALIKLNPPDEPVEEPAVPPPAPEAPAQPSAADR
jgi:hypothetical protein